MILHADLDAFYASVAQRDEPSLRGKPIVVAGSSRRAVVLTASYEARAFGIRSAMPAYQAKERCIDLLVVAPDFEKYRAASEQVFAIFRQHARAVEGLSLDEAFLDLGDCSLEEACATARRIKHAVRGASALAVSIGIGSGKMVAKIACDQGKPDGLVAVAPGTEAGYLAGKPVRTLWGIGPKTEQRLRSQGLNLIGDIAVLDDGRLHGLFGRWGTELRELARGVDPRPVVEEWETRSISSEETFEQDMTDRAELAQVIAVQAREVAGRLQRKQLGAGTVGIKVKFSDRHTCGRQTSFVEPVSDEDAIAQAAIWCLDHLTLSLPVRLIGVRASNLVQHEVSQTTLFAAHRPPA